MRPDYVDAVIADIRSAVDAGMPVADTVFVGGGTPTLIEPAHIARIIEAVPLSAAPEVTVECNPDDVTADLMDTYAAAGVNRVSIGVQSMVPHVLASLGRAHDPANVRTAVECARAAGIDRVNLDLVLELRNEDGSPPYLVEWSDTGQRSLYFPGSDGHVEHYGDEPPKREPEFHVRTWKVTVPCAPTAYRFFELVPHRPLMLRLTPVCRVSKSPWPTRRRPRSPQVLLSCENAVAFLIADVGTIHGDLAAVQFLQMTDQA